MKISAKARKNRLNVRVRLSLSERINTSEIDFLQKRVIMGLLKPKQLRKRLIEYTGPAAISLQERMKKPITKSEFLLMMAQLTDINRKMRSNNLLAKNICLDMRYVFSIESTGELQFLYIPIESSFVGADFLGFMSALVYEAKPFEGQSSEYISAFAFQLRSLDTFDVDKIEAYIAREDRSVMEKIKRGPLDSRGAITDKHSSCDDDLNMDTGKLDASDRISDADFDYDEATGLLDQSEMFARSGEIAAFDGTDSYASSDEKPGETALLNGPEDFSSQRVESGPSTPSAKAYLYRVQTDEKIALNKPVFRIGKERSYVDYFVSNNGAVSRSHADIIMRGSRFYIRDLNSKNRTFINGNAVAPEYETELNDGDNIRLANEEFVFHAR